MSFVGAALVDDDLVGISGRVTALNEVELVQLLYRVPTETQRGRALTRVADRLVLAVDELRVIDLHVALRGLDAGRLGDDRLDRSGDRRARACARAALVVLECLRPAYLRVGSLVDVRDEVVEGLLDGRR